MSRCNFVFVAGNHTCINCGCTVAAPKFQRVVATCNVRKGPGTELKALIASFGLNASGDCKCRTRAALMDANGCDWCEANIEEIVGWLRESAAERGLPFVDIAGRVLIRRAIANARRKEQARAQASAQAEGPAAG